MHSQRMASIALSIIGCIDYLAYGTIFTRAMFRPKKKVDVFFFARKAADEPWEVVGGFEYTSTVEKVQNYSINFNGLASKLTFWPLDVG